MIKTKAKELTGLATQKKTLINVLGVVYAHHKTSDGGDIYLTRFAEEYQRHFDISNWYEKEWFNRNKIRLEGTGSVYRVPTKEVDGKILDLVIKTLVLEKTFLSIPIRFRNSVMPSLTVLGRSFPWLWN